MASLRARLLAGVLVLSAAGLVLLGAVTYAEQRSFLQSRVDQETRASVDALSRLLDARGLIPAGAPAQPNGDEGQDAAAGRAPGRGPVGALVNLPPGTYGQRRSASQVVLGRGITIEYSASEAKRPPPDLPATVPLGRLFTVHAVGGSDLHYRAYAQRDPEDTGITVVAVPSSDVDQTLQRLLIVEALVIGGVLIALAVLAWFVVRLGLRPLSRMEVTAGAIATGELSRRVSPATARTEVGRLGLALNGMLERLERAFGERQASEDRLRQFLADASHELRTPLASIRGYAELFRMGATGDRAGTETAMRRIEEESKRMGILVEDLLTLARLDETPELTRRPVDLVPVAEDAIKDACATDTGRTIALSAVRPAIASGDANQLRQVVSNLLRNAVVHTPPGTAIDVSIEQDAHSVTLSVRDHGHGLPDISHERLFDRFWRAEGGRERGKAGAGLGLSIVSGIVAAHHGTIDARNAADGGAIFTVRLPREHSRTDAEDPAAADGEPSSHTHRSAGGGGR